MYELLGNIAMGALGGFGVAISGYVKSSTGEFFELDKFLLTVILGTIVGGAVGLTGLAPEAIIAFPAYAGITAMIENLLKKAIRGWGPELFF